MDIVHCVQPVTVLKTRSADLIRQVRESGEPVVITQNGKPSAVLQDVSSYQRQQDRIAMLKLVAQGMHDYDEGRTVPASEVKQRFTSKLKAMADGAETL
ncbi:MAG: type II toxin-antitoxin system Phd/YefM family antitoxin [Planctomycetota bacterium]|jgi:prevent-host-death family protein